MPWHYLLIQCYKDDPNTVYQTTKTLLVHGPLQVNEQNLVEHVRNVLFSYHQVLHL